MMKTLLLILLGVTGCLLLTGCGPIYETTYSYVPPRSGSGKVCTMQCEQTKMMCQRLHQSQGDECRERARHEARRGYHEYARERRRQHLPVTKTIDDFVNPFACPSRTTNSRCDEDYRACYQACGGQVIPERRCVAFCDQASP